MSKPEKYKTIEELDRILKIAFNAIGTKDGIDGKMALKIETLFEKYCDEMGVELDLNTELNIIPDESYFFLHMYAEKDLYFYMLLHPPLIDFMFENKKNKDEFFDTSFHGLYAALKHMAREIKIHDSDIHEQNKIIKKWALDCVKTLNQNVDLGRVKEKGRTKKMSFLHSFMWRISSMHKSEDKFNSELIHEMIEMGVPVCTDVKADYPYVADRIPQCCQVIKSHIEKSHIKEEVDAQKKKQKSRVKII